MKQPQIVSIAQRTPGDFPKLDDLKPGDKLVADDAFTCLRTGEVVTVEEDATGLYVRCCAHDNGEHGRPVNDSRYDRHYLDGQEGADGECVGLFRHQESQK